MFTYGRAYKAGGMNIAGNKTKKHIEATVGNSHRPDNPVLSSPCKDGVVHAVHDMEQTDNQQDNRNTGKEDLLLS